MAKRRNRKKVKFERIGNNPVYSGQHKYLTPLFAKEWKAKKDLEHKKRSDMFKEIKSLKQEKNKMKNDTLKLKNKEEKLIKRAKKLFKEINAKPLVKEMLKRG